MGMKKVWLAIVAAVVLLLAVLIPLVIGMGQQGDQHVYVSNLAKYSAECAAAEGLPVEWEDGSTVLVPSEKVSLLIDRLTTGRALRVRLTEAPARYDAKLTLRMGDNATVDVYALDEAKNNTAIVEKFGDTLIAWGIDGLRIYGWIEDIALGKAV